MRSKPNTSASERRALGHADSLIDGGGSREAIAQVLRQDFRRCASLRAPHHLEHHGLKLLLGTARFASLADWVQGTVKGWTLADRLDEDAVMRLTRELERELSHLVRSDGSFCFGSRAHVVRLVAGS